MCEVEEEKMVESEPIEEIDVDVADEYFEELRKIALKIVNIRKRSLFVMYYPPGGSILELDIEQIYDELKDNIGAEKLDDLDLLLHTLGGSPDAAYLITQILHDFSDSVTVLVPKRAMSAGTLICLGTNEIKLGAHATLSPIDISLVSADRPDDSIHLVNLDFYLKFVEHFKKMMDSNNIETEADKDLMVELVRSIHPLDIGHFFRVRELTLFYARLLLEEYMFSGLKYKENDAKEISNKLVFELPSHELLLDYHIARRIGLCVSEMDVELSDICGELVESLNDGVDRYLCWYLGNDQHIPYFKLYTYKEV